MSGKTPRRAARSPRRKGGTATLRSLTKRILAFRDARDWKRFHTPKDMALSLCLEAAEVLEWMQWKNGADLDAHLAKRRREVGEELSDVLYWVLLLAHDLDIDLSTAFRRKMAVNARKYPVRASKGTATKYSDR